MIAGRGELSEINIQAALMSAMLPWADKQADGLMSGEVVCMIVESHLGGLHLNGLDDGGMPA